MLNLNDDEIVEAIVDDGMDGGIDAIHLTDTDVHIVTYTYTESFDKTHSNFPQNKLDNLVVTVQKIMTRSLSGDDVNPALWEKVQAIWGLLNEGVPDFHFHVCSNKEHPTDAAKRRFEESLKPFRFVSFHYMSLEDVVSVVLERRHRRVDGEITFIDRSYFPKADGPLKATVAAVAATNLISLIKDPEDDKRINEDIFNDNVRVDLGLRNAINTGIYESALAERYPQKVCKQSVGVPSL